MSTSTVGHGVGVVSSRERLLRTLRGQAVDRPPVWFMRQAGRHLPGYRELRVRHSFLDLCRNEGICAAASAEPVERYGLDAAIVFNDILVPLMDMGLPLDFVPGPRFERLVASSEDVGALRDPAYGPQTDVARCLRALRREIGGGIGMFGFVGAPLTVASFAIGGVGAGRAPLEELAISKGEVFRALQRRLVGVLSDYAAVQAEAGADAIQVFESLGDQLPEPAFRTVGLPFLCELLDSISSRVPGIPVVAFGRGLWPYIDELSSRCSALSLDHTRPLAEARRSLRSLGRTTALQGNLDPEVLLETLERAAAGATRLLEGWREIVECPSDGGEGATGWIFNLGHGVPAEADPATVQSVVDCVKRHRYGGRHA